TRPLLVLMAALLLAAATASAQESGRVIRGTIHMGTPGATLGPVAVSLIAPSQGMAEVATTTARNGRFEITDIPAGPPFFLLRAEYQGVTYNQPVRLTGAPATVEFTVYEVSDRWQGVKVSERRLLRTDGRIFRVDELIQVDNPGDHALYKEGGLLPIFLPQGRTGETTITVRAQGQPVQREPVATDDPEIFTVDYPIRPGVTQVTVSYTLPYPGKRLHYEARLPWDLPRVDLFVQPADVTVTPAPPLEVAGRDQQRDLIYVRGAAVKAGDRIAVDLAGGSAVGGGHGQFQVSVEPNRTRAWAPWVILGIGGCLILTAVFARKGEGPAPAAASPKEAARLKESLVAAIAALDDRLAQGAISRRQHQRQRAELLQRLEETLRRMDRAAG
ncbi:MAG: carboxypeptidase regulatory-like domain-containing protein, partial [Nitrospirae bacterium]